MSKESRSGGAGADRRNPRLLIYPVGDTEARILLEGQTEGAVATVAAAPGQELGRDGTAGRDGLAIEPDEMIDAELVDIGVVGGLFAREICKNRKLRVDKPTPILYNT